MPKSILLFSGGLDSTLVEWKVKPDILLYVDMKTTYSQMEVDHLMSLDSYYKDRLLIRELPLGEYEKPDMFLPYRNLILICIALQYAPKVYLGFTGQDNSIDCQESFIKKARSLFRLLNKDNKGHLNWSEKEFSIEAPYRELTKSEMIADCLKNGMPVETVQNTRTCYSGVSENGCGMCLPCWNKAVALLNNGIFREDLFDSKIPEEMFKQSFDFYEKTWGKDKYKLPHYKEVAKAYKLLRQIRK